MAGLQIRGGPESERANITPAERELIVTTDAGSEALFIGDGVTPGGKPLGGSGAGSPLTTKGDLYVYASGNTRLPVGANGQVLTADATSPSGLRWAAGGSGGSTAVITEASGPTDLDVGAVADGQYLRRAGSTVIGANPGAATQLITVTSNRTLSAGDAGATLVCSGNVTLTLPASIASSSVFNVLNVGSGVVSFATSGGATLAPAIVLDNLGEAGQVGVATLVKASASAYYAIGGQRPVEAFMVALSDEATPLTAGAGKLTMRLPYALRLTGVRASVTTAPVGGAGIAVDVNLGGASIFSVRPGIEAGETSTTTASVQPVLSTTLLPDDGLLTFDIDSVGSSTPGAGLKVTLLGYRR